ncbi:uncharacterized protein RHIMIDRAFT_223885 [Rhizopus microsporus ATCC 52813]|uniref:Arrestin-like N-terminal domain-containing protein n=2 Tax=Rhizopus microsporus TaxID=58291 RepID=A0A2G4T4H1_RHIZD|nr:uncharacterized protein RHIMIDRAFT_223885 [Rhizopus microsporus ATCC 52813]PHZ15576.1 hypothetical protein RHIMIDRAFT_223885 [Rhizopus microsporus ATCC 52813]
MPIAVPFLSGSKQLSIVLAEPVVLLRGPPTEPTTHVLRGEVELLLSKPMTATHVTIKLVGKSNILWPEGLGPRGNKVYHEKTILEQNIILDSRPAEDQQTLPAGLNRWPFEFLIPNSIVETIEDEMAQVYYYICATVERPGFGTPNLRCRRNVLLLRTLAPSNDALTSHALPTTSIVAERRTEACDATFYIEKSIVSSGTQFPISIVLLTQMKHVQLESIDIVLTERRVYQVPEYGARKAELHDFKLQLVSVTDMTDSEQLQQTMTPSLDIPTQQIRRALSGKNAHIPLGSTPFQYKFIFTLPNCLTLNHTTYFKEMNFLHHLKIDLEFSVPSTASSSSSSTKSPELERTHIHLETPITILDCRLKEDFVTLPTYQEALTDAPVSEHENEEDLLKKRAGFFICPCYVEYKKKSTTFTGKEWDVILHNSGTSSCESSYPNSRNVSQESLILLPPPPPYNQLEK